MIKHIKGVLFPAAKGRGGVKVEHHKGNTENCKSVRMPIPEKVVLPMQQHIGAPCVPTVKVGDTVKVGQLIGDTDKFISAPIHASVSGKVTSVAETILANGRLAPAVTIESDGEMALYEGIEPPTVNSEDDFLSAVRNSGLVGLGGAGFPSHVKFHIDPKKPIDTIVVNAAECEPFITVDYRECVDNTLYIIRSLMLIKERLGIQNAVIAVEDNKPLAIEKLQKAVDEIGDGTIKVMSLKSRYPQGAEKMIVYSATGRKIPLGKLPADVGCIVMNVASTAFIGRYLETGKPLVSRSLTVDGSAITTPKNVRVPIGTNLNELIEFCGGLNGPLEKVIAGGPMMGASLVSTDVPIIKSYNAVLAFQPGTLPEKLDHDCIRCGRCSQVCPMGLMPTNIMRSVKVKDIDGLKSSSVMACMQCGSCAFACPAGKPLVQYLVLAKDMLREDGAKK
ncbi:MAG: electron transport complex subunit RsxC [Oscillospiraceae bacterium]|nr:electron transport complex subunit RsxC [Oscillospiraceae bacterium]